MDCVTSLFSTKCARCAELIFVSPCFEKYSRASKAARATFAVFDPDFEACSLDEACLDITDYCAAHGMTGAHLCNPTPQACSDV